MTENASFSPKKEKTKTSFTGRLIQLFFLMLFLGCAATAWDAYRFLNTPASEDPKEVSFTIIPGSTLIRVAWDLKKAGLITDVNRFQLLAYFKDDLGNIQAGEFTLSTGWTPEQVLHQITKGQARLYRLSIREGLTWWETAKAVEEQGFATFDDFKEVIHDPEFLKEHNIPFANAEGFLFPETYLLRKPRQPLDKAQAREVASLMVRMFWKKTAPAWNQLPLKKGITITAADRAASPYAPARDTSQPAPPAGQKNGTASPAQGSTATVPATAAQAATPPAVNATLPETNKPGAAQATAPANATATAAPPPVAGPVFAANATVQESPTAAATVNATTANATSVNAASVNATADADNAPLPQKKLPAWDDTGPQRPSDANPAALRRLVILATLVEKETGLPPERFRVAGVYSNRLRLGMLLQCDPTIIYGVGPSFSGSIRRSQLDDEKNLYNTYKHAGLPPGPICSPGMEAVIAAAWPEEHEYLFFVATGLGDGGHIFSKTVGEHNKAVQVYRARMQNAR